VKPQPPSKIFDPLKLDAMTEPLFVRVEKKKGNVRSMIPLPAGEEGSPQGANFSKEDVRGLEAWLVTEWSGGGYYAITVSDSTAPNPQKMDWEIYYQPSEYPEKVPPTLSAAMSDRPISSPQPQQQQVRLMSNGYPSAFPNGFPSGLPGQSFQQPFQGYSVPTTRADYGSGRESFFAAQAASQASSQVEAERRRYEDQLRELQAQLARAREEQLAAQHRQELERVRSEQEARMRVEQVAQNDRFTKLEQLIASMATNNKPVIDPAIEQLKEQNRILAMQAENEKRERDAERRERELRDQMLRQAEDTRRQIEALTALQAQNANKGLDPLILMMQENARQQVEAAREQARQATTQMSQLQAFMMNPRDIMAMAKESSNGLDQATRSITSTYQDILSMQRQAVEQILQLNNTGGSETIALVKEGLERASSFAERFIGGKTREAVTAQQTQAQLAQANATAMTAQAAAMQAQAAMQANAARQQLPQGQQVPSNGAPINGAPIKPPPVNQGPTNIAPRPATDAWSTAPVAPLAPEIKVQRHLGRTDQEWFGPILPKVTELREGADRFLDSLKQAPPRLTEDGHVDGIEPEQAADLILQATMLVMQQQIPIPAMTDLLGQGRIADFMDTLLPNAPQPYRDEVAQMVLHELQGGGDNDDDDDDDDEELDDPGEAKKPAPIALVRPAPQARA
jgi:hypothetical protein